MVVFSDVRVVERFQPKSLRLIVQSPLVLDFSGSDKITQICNDFVHWLLLSSQVSFDGAIHTLSSVVCQSDGFQARCPKITIKVFSNDLANLAQEISKVD